MRARDWNIAVTRTLSQGSPPMIIDLARVRAKFLIIMHANIKSWKGHLHPYSIYQLAWWWIRAARMHTFRPALNADLQVDFCDSLSSLAYAYACSSDLQSWYRKQGVLPITHSILNRKHTCFLRYWRTAQPAHALRVRSGRSACDREYV